VGEGLLLGSQVTLFALCPYMVESPERERAKDSLSPTVFGVVEAPNS
jgi:hypothetical protein